MASVATQTETKPQLSPPWWTLYNKIRTSIGANPSVHVGLMDTSKNPYTIPVICTDLATAVGLKTLLIPVYHIGNITVQVNVVTLIGQPPATEASTGDPVDAVIKAVHEGLGSNAYFVQVIKNEPPPPFGPSVGQVVVVFKPAVIQFFNDDLSDYYSNLNAVAEDIFGAVLQTQYPGNVKLAVTTQPHAHTP